MKEELTVPQIRKELEELKRGIDEAKISRAKLSGREEELLKQLKEDHSLSSEAEAIKKVSDLKTDLQKITKKIQDKFAQLKENYSW